MCILKLWRPQTHPRGEAWLKASGTPERAQHLKFGQTRGLKSCSYPARRWKEPTLGWDGPQSAWPWAGASPIFPFSWPLLPWCRVRSTEGILFRARPAGVNRRKAGCFSKTKGPVNRRAAAAIHQWGQSLRRELPAASLKPLEQRDRESQVEAPKAPWCAWAGVDTRGTQGSSSLSTPSTSWGQTPITCWKSWISPASTSSFLSWGPC